MRRRLQKRGGGGALENYTSGRMGPTLSPQIDKVSMKCKISFSSRPPLYSTQINPMHSLHPFLPIGRVHTGFLREVMGIISIRVVFLHRRSPFKFVPTFILCTVLYCLFTLLHNEHFYPPLSIFSIVFPFQCAQF